MKNIHKILMFVMMVLSSVMVYAEETTLTLTQVTDASMFNTVITLIILTLFLMVSFILKQSILGILASIGVLIFSFSLYSISTSLGLIATAFGLGLMLLFGLIEW